MIQAKARSLSKKQVYQEEYPDIKNVKLSQKWVDGFMSRHNLVNRKKTTISQKLPENYIGLQIVLACTANGIKLPPVIIFKLVNVSREEFPDGVIIQANKEGWMNESEMIWWIENVWTQHARRRANPRSLLILDSFTAHKTSAVLKKMKLVSESESGSESESKSDDESGLEDEGDESGLEDEGNESESENDYYKENEDRNIVQNWN
ncbi:pogo transposable element with KRAB domain [Rhizophagus irregularis DAOM 181602=DAOM 197198]|uniref:Uncharacterized protein n=1 Tax=Rhizophagus irregularis (strain DAOM 181602 / DAOM 197198 / MUCL 43194) TaxID=747089 RepID=U9UNY8_RHIID|nr:pogo transposable element with KRAB domain [Rhizophagus irregularis DAOM 181602=DAOM 197198]